eukprot:1466790-Prymnesium_polylepis.1
MVRPKAAPTTRSCSTHHPCKAAHICQKHVRLWCRPPPSPTLSPRRRKMCYVQIARIACFVRVGESIAP